MHHDFGSVAGLGLGSGIFQSGPIAVRGLPARLMHRGTRPGAPRRDLRAVGE